MLGLMVSKAEAEYADGAGKNVQLEITDTGGASGMLPAGKNSNSSLPPTQPINIVVWQAIHKSL